MSLESVVSKFKRFPEVLNRELRTAIKEWLTSVQVEARLVHRYTTRTAALDRSIQAKMEKDGGVVYLEEGIARYGQYIHEGFKRWAPDPFLIDAGERKQPQLQRGIVRGIALSLSKVGL